ncbi:hypothetical protein [Thalassoroseus pseudoceratinae]|uniref:hypothetical protein n=1 Tax=Thalassoroseus pseudoceratinae TaxID=2713176 RepID=UPI00142398B6|nr:hypothetical protein [Thalassoroseus pseudoceratinae]
MQNESWGSLLSNYFGNRDPSQVEVEWKSLKANHAVGDKVTGVVVAKAPYGAWLDVHGFPALLEIICIDGLTPERYQAGDWCPIGSHVSGFIGGFRDDVHQIGIYQVRPGQTKDDQ